MLTSVKKLCLFSSLFFVPHVTFAQIIIIPDDNTPIDDVVIVDDGGMSSGIFTDDTFQKKSVSGETVVIVDDEVSTMGAAAASAVSSEMKMGRSHGLALQVPSKNGSGSTQTVFIPAPKLGEISAASSKMGSDKNYWEAWFYRDQNFFDNQPYLSYEFTSPAGDNGTIFNKNWGQGGPSQINYQSNDFGMYLAKQTYFQTGCYSVSTTSDDGSALYLNNVLILDNWGDHGATTKKVYLQVLRPSARLMQGLFYENTGDASLKITREFHGNVSCEMVINKPDPVIPTPPTRFLEWKSEFFSWQDLAPNYYPFGAIPQSYEILTQQRRVLGPINLTSLSFDSKVGVPIALMAGDYWGAKFERTMSSDGGCYNFNVTVDDGVRVKVDGMIVVDDWKEWSRRTLTNNAIGGTCLNLSYGNHTVVVEFIEKTGDAVLFVNWEKGWNPGPNPSTGSAQIALPYLSQWRPESPCWAKIERVMNTGARIPVPQVFADGSTNPGLVWANNGQNPLIATVTLIPGTVGFEVTIGKGADTWEYTKRLITLYPGQYQVYDQGCY